MNLTVSYQCYKEKDVLISKKKKDVLISKKRKRKKKKGCAFSIEKQQIDGYHKNIWFDSL